MKTKPLTQVCNITTGKLDANAETPGGKYLFFTCAPSPLRIDTYAFDDDVILLAGNNAQGNFHIQRYKGKFNAYQRTYVITAKRGYDIDYIKYSLELSLQHLKRVAQGSQTKFLTMQILDSFHVADIPYDDQKRLVGSVREIDKKISTNLDICSELESLAKTIYDYWFTQFDFPDADGNPYRSSGGAMEWNEQLKRKVPKGWGGGTINSLMKTENTSVNPRKLGNTLMEHYSIPAFDTDHCPVYEEASTIESNKYAVDLECILTSKLNPHFKRLWDPYCDTENAICSTEFIVYRPRTSWMRPFCYAVLNSDAFYVHMSSKATASTGSRKRIQPDVSASFELPIPDEDTIRSFVELYGPIMEKQKALYKENRELTKLRDWLLPMLMNGQATVEDAEEEVSKVIPFVPQTVEVRQAARNFGDKETDDTADLVKAFMRRKKNDSKA